MPSVSEYVRQVRRTLRDPVFDVWVACIMLVHLGSMTPIVSLVQRGLDTGEWSGTDAEDDYNS